MQHEGVTHTLWETKLNHAEVQKDTLYWNNEYCKSSLSNPKDYTSSCLSV